MLQGQIDSLISAFERSFGKQPAFIARAPGRVNLLGEHTDYNGLPVLPMAIDRCVLIAGRARDDRRISLVNTDRAFAPRQYEISDDIAPYDGGDWGNYSKAAVQGLVRYGLQRQHGPRLDRGADLAVDGNIPAGAGLSSSSALVVASALAILAANEGEVGFVELAELLPAAERYVGTLSGGMDQAASLLAQEGKALRIDFFPLRTRAIPMPKGYSVLVCHSLVRAEKSGAAKRAYNLRVIECRLACRALDRILAPMLPRPLRTMGDLASIFPQRALAELMPDLEQNLPDRPLSLAAVAAAIGVDPEELRRECEVPRDVGDRFCPVRRARHVLSEADRVNRAEAMLGDGDVEGFARLMDGSHASCRDDYAISCPQLEELVAHAKAAGALGARLTGAGFGGCTGNLVRDDRVAVFLEQIDRSFYSRRLAAAARTADYRFAFRPQAGAGVVRLA